MSIRLTRREALVTGAAAALPLLSQPARAEAIPGPEAKPVIGVSTLGFPGFTNAELALELAANDVTTIQLFLTQKDSNYWVYNGRNDLSPLGEEECRAIAEAYTSQGIDIHSIGVYTNLVHPDEEERNANLAYFGEMFRVGAAMNVRTFITEAGHYEPPEHHGVPHHFKEEVWHQMVRTGKRLGEMAADYDATVLVEPFYRGFLASAKRTRLFIEDIGSPRVRALLDPANLIEINDLSEMFTQLGPYIDCLHAKDRKLHVDRGVAAGQGDLDYDEFVALAARHAPHAPFILEYVGPDDYKQALDLLRAAVARHHGQQ